MNKLPNYSKCFVCGEDNPAGLAVRFHVDGDVVYTTFTTTERHMGFHGVMHGGATAAVMDEVMGWAPSLANKRFCVCVKLEVEYRKAIPLGQEVTAYGWMTNDRRRMWETAGEIRDAEGTVYAKGKGRYVPFTDEQTNAVADVLTFDEGCVPRDRVFREPGAAE